MMLPFLLDAEPQVPWSVIVSAVGGILGLVGVVSAYAYKRDNEALKEKAQTGIDQANKALGENQALKTELANARTRFAELEGELKVIKTEIRIRAEIVAQNEVLQTQTDLLEAIAARTGSKPVMRAVVPRRDERREPSDPPDPDPPPLPPMRPRLGSRRGGE